VNVVAIGDRVKLTTDSIQRIPQDRIAAGQAIAAEIRRVGELVREMMRVATSEELPAAFRAIEIASARATGSQWSTPAQLLGLLRGEPPSTPERVVTEPPPGDLITEEPAGRSGLGRKAVVAAVLMLIALAAWVLIPRDESARAADELQQSRPQAALETKSEPAPPPLSAAPMAITAPTGAGGDWAVVAAIYRNFNAAARQAERLKKSWQATPPAVFPAEGQGRKYMVVLASGLSKREAEKVRKDALAAGMPADTYVTRLNSDPPAPNLPP
jgi:hypothetical protein